MRGTGENLQQRLERLEQTGDEVLLPEAGDGHHRTRAGGISVHVVDDSRSA